jgi:hypothetical protein
MMPYQTSMANNSLFSVGRVVQTMSQMWDERAFLRQIFLQQSRFELFDVAKQFIERAYGETLNLRDASYHVPELYAAQSIVEQVFEKGEYQQVIDLFDWSLQFEENLSEPSEPDDFLTTAYMPLAILCLRSQIRLGKTPAEVAEIFTRMRDADEYGLFCRLPRLESKEEVDLAPVKKILAKPRK